MSSFRKNYPDGPPPELGEVYWLKTHGGLGDIQWLYSKGHNFDRPLFISISQENRSRPRRSGYLVDHLPRVVGWKFDDTTFAPAGQDWSEPQDPCCAIGMKFADLGIRPNVPHRLECNKWLEMGNRLETWLPDVPTTFHFDFEPCGPPNIKFASPYVILHMAGWPDVHDSIWIQAVDLFAPFAKVYIVGGSYDYRPRRIYNLVARGGSKVSLLEDLAWEDMFALIKGAEFVFGHASGFTTLADVLRCKGAVVNPRSVPRLTGTWNSPDNPGLVQAATPEEFQQAIYAAYRRLAGGPTATWPPVITAGRGARLTAGAAGAEGAIRAAAVCRPRSVAVVNLATEEPPGLASSILHGVYDDGGVIDSVCLFGCGPHEIAAAARAGMRSTRRPVVEPTADPWPGKHRQTTFDLVVIHTGNDPATSADTARSAWARLTPTGTLLAGGRTARPAVESLGATLKIQPAAVEGAPDWYYLHRRA